MERTKRAHTFFLANEAPMFVAIPDTLNPWSSPTATVLIWPVLLPRWVMARITVPTTQTQRPGRTGRGPGIYRRKIAADQTPPPTHSATHPVRAATAASRSFRLQRDLKGELVFPIAITITHGGSSTHRIAVLQTPGKSLGWSPVDRFPQEILSSMLIAIVRHHARRRHVSTKNMPWRLSRTPAVSKSHDGGKIKNAFTTSWAAKR